MKKNLYKNITSMACIVMALLFAIANSTDASESLQDGTNRNQHIIASNITQQEETSGYESSTLAEEISKELFSGKENTEILMPENENKKSWQKLENYFSADLRILAYGVAQNPAESNRNPNNDFLEIPHYVTNTEIRPDFYFNSNYLDLSVKPRSTFQYNIWKEGMRDGDTDWNDDWYVNEWIARVKAWNKLFLSYGRENLQWGPSFLYSPSNPFFSDNGRSNNYMEVQGMDFARILFVPHLNWSISLIVNTDEGRNSLPNSEPFEKIYALKVDYTGINGYASLIYSRKDSSQSNKIGFFGGWTASDALLLYTESSVQNGSDAWYPVTDSSLFGASLQQVHQDDDDVTPTILVGGAYTFLNSGTLTLEYLYNGPGYDRDEANLTFSTLKKAADAYYSLMKSAESDSEKDELADSLQEYLSSQNTDPGLRFLRRNYAMLQYYQVNIRNRLAITLRWTQNIDDGSGQFFGLFSYQLGDHWDLFGSGIINAGNKNTEYGSILDYQGMLGLKLSL